MTQNIEIPAYLTPLESLSTVQLVGEIREKKDADGRQKRSDIFGAVGWILPCEIIRGQKKKILPTGETWDVLDVEKMNITLWNNTTPTVKVGDYFRVIGGLVGCFDSNLFLQCVDVASADTLDSLDSLVGEG